MKVMLFLVFILQLSASVFGARILAIEPYGSKSHWQFMKAILDLLTARHKVTVITPLPTGDQHANYTEIDASNVLPVYSVSDTLNMIEQFSSVFKMLPLVPARSQERDICDAFYNFEPVKYLLTNSQHSKLYDVVLLEPFNLPCLSYLAYRLHVPEIYIIPSSMVTSMEMTIFGTEPSPAHVPHLLYHGTQINNFWHRLTNVALLAYTKFVPWLTNARMRFQELKCYDIPEVRHKPTVVFINTHHITEAPRPFPETMVQIGGIHLKPPEPLPKDILEFMDNAPNGVIYFAFGSVTSMSSLPDEIKDVFIKAFAEIPQRVLWKYDGELKNLPDNVMIKHWFPQRDILLHPNIKLFISHGGISGVYEAVDAGVPILGFPLFYDQPRNMGHLIDAGIALWMDLLTVDKFEFLDTIDKLINNKNYSSNAKMISKLFKHRLIPPSEMVSYWFEYVLLHKEVNFLNSKALQLKWYQYWLLDVIAFLFVVHVVLVYTMFVLICWFKHFIYEWYRRLVIYYGNRRKNKKSSIIFKFWKKTYCQTDNK